MTSYSISTSSDRSNRKKRLWTTDMTARVWALVFWGSLAALALVWLDRSARALELDWSGQFRAEHHYLSDYSNTSGVGAAIDPSTPVARNVPVGYTINKGGAGTAQFQSIFLRMRPNLVVSDNVYIKSEWWAGDPIFGFFGNAAPYTYEQRQFYSTGSRGSPLTAQRFYAEVLTDLGVLQVGRMPLHWGLGAVWNAGDGMWDRYLSTGDAIRFMVKAGQITVIPSVIKYSMGNTAGGSCAVLGVACTTTSGRGNVSDYSIALKYENLDEDIEGGVNFFRHLVDSGQDPTATGTSYTGPDTFSTGRGSSFNVFDIYAKKKLSKVSFGVEAPFTSGKVGGLDYSTWALAAEASYQLTSSIGVMVKGGRAPGQPSSAGNPSKFEAFYFHPAYHLGMIMFNYQLANMGALHTNNSAASSPAGLRSPFDNPITNATYLAVGADIAFNKWHIKPGFVMASATQTAKANQTYYNSWSRSFNDDVSGKNQDAGLGTEFDLGVELQLDEHFQFGIDMGLYVPGAFFKYANNATGENESPTIFATAFKIGVNF